MSTVSEAGKAGYSIPSEEMVRQTILKVLEGNVTISSQTRFHALILKHLKNDNGGKRFRLSPRRLRKISAVMDNVDLIIHCREGKTTFKGKSCPVCGSEMSDIKNQTLYGWTISTGKYCETCHYWSGKRKRIPIRYVFTIEKENYIEDQKKEV
ncbi:MAG: hypothetical protein ACMUIG_02195 [Thermoplasmatota archaeon]